MIWIFGPISLGSLQFRGSESHSQIPGRSQVDLPDHLKTSVEADHHLLVWRRILVHDSY
jgi:hypothetical protein